MSARITFPDPGQADPDGLLAYGGDLSTDTLITAYSRGIFPWYSENQPILWWSPDPRMCLFPDDFKVSDSLMQRIRKKEYEIRIDTCFEDVIRNCALIKRKNQEGTWIHREMIEAYISLHKKGFAHSFETFRKGQLVGGLYGISLGKAFFGESMFHKMSDASKIALYYLVNKLKEWKFLFIDAQQVTSHMRSMGAQEVSRRKFLDLLNEALKYRTIQGKWGEESVVGK